MRIRLKTEFWANDDPVVQLLLSEAYKELKMKVPDNEE
jgi:hypothetical protein